MWYYGPNIRQSSLCLLAEPAIQFFYLSPKIFGMGDLEKIKELAWDRVGVGCLKPVLELLNVCMMRILVDKKYGSVKQRFYEILPYRKEWRIFICFQWS